MTELPAPDSTELADRIRVRGLPEAMVTIATKGGAVIHPALRGQADAVNARGWSVARRHPHWVPLWSSGAMVTMVGPDGSLARWSVELSDESLRTYTDLADAVRNLLTDLWELDEDDTGADDRRSIAEALLPRDAVPGALTPIER
ncbi:hypothetical protein [Microbacterium sp.]|uniref:hypothetical protein n=1 Tax=Microbacterium sp. TaxID=51671 RepID=UPI0039E34D27